MRVTLTEITKRFGTNTANDSVSIDFRPGEVHTLLGENGAGKTTLVRMLAGLLQPDSGTISIGGHPRTVASPAEAVALGIALVSQHPVVASHLSVFENLICSAALARRGLFDRAALRRRVAEVASRCGITFDFDRKVADVGLGTRKQIEIVRALLADARLIIFDEPTDVLTPSEGEQLFQLVRALAAEGRTIVLITHSLPEAIAHSDAITILQKGRVVARVVPSETSTGDLAERMVGILAPVAVSVLPPKAGKDVLEVQDVTVVRGGRPMVRGVSLSVGQGEILGLAGVAGNGQEELVEAIVGLLPMAGRISIAGVRVDPGATRRLMRDRLIGYVPADRHRDGMVGPMTVADNLGLEVLEGRDFARLGFRRMAAASRHARRLMEEYDVQPPMLGLAAERLSGGNQQKLILARVLDRNPRLLVICNPTRGLDVGAARWVWDSIRRNRNEGGTVVLMSSDLEEVRALSDRILVFFRGTISGEIAAADASADRLGLLMGGAGSTHAA